MSGFCVIVRMFSPIPKLWKNAPKFSIIFIFPTLFLPPPLSSHSFPLSFLSSLSPPLSSSSFSLPTKQGSRNEIRPEWVFGQAGNQKSQEWSLEIMTREIIESIKSNHWCEDKNGRSSRKWSSYKRCKKNEEQDKVKGSDSETRLWMLHSFSANKNPVHVISIHGGLSGLSRAGQLVNTKSKEAGVSLGAHSSETAESALSYHQSCFL